jgi:uncharacterized protein (UPF0210 family)
MIAVPGDTPWETISAIIADEAAIGVDQQQNNGRAHHTTPGKTVGDRVDFRRPVGSAPVMP